MSQPAKLEVLRNAIDRGDRRLDVLAPITRRASGKVKVELHAAGERYRFDAAVNSAKGYVRFDKRIPRAQARLGTGIVTITYPGNENTRGQEARLRAASGRAQLDAQRPELEVVDGALRMQSEGKLSERARGVVRVQLDWVDSAGVDRSYEANAKIDDGAWRLSEALPGEVRQSIEGRLSTVHSYTLFTGYYRARMRGEMKAYQVLPAPEGTVGVPQGGSPAAPLPLEGSAGAANPPAETSSTPPPAPTGPLSVLAPGQTLGSGESITSPSGRYRLVMQTDGNLVLYDGTTGKWNSRTTGADGSRAVMQTDGNLVVYSGSAVQWKSDTGRFDGAELRLQDDGNLVIYRNGLAIWTYTSGYIGNSLGSGVTLPTGAFLYSADRQYKLVMQTDGNLVMYGGTTVLFKSDTRGTGLRAEMQRDGNLVVREGATSTVWDSKTMGFSGGRLLVQNDGNLVVYHAGRGIWTRAAGYIGDTLRSGMRLPAGAYLRSADRRYRLVMQPTDGNLALYGPDGALWSIGSTGHPGASAIMQGDGNFVVYSGTTAVKHTETAGETGAFIKLQDDSNLVIYRGTTARWSRTTGLIGSGEQGNPNGPAAAATSWAAAQLGKRTADPADAALFNDWVPGPYGEWSGDCAKFVITAWYRAGVSIARGNAREQYEAYAHRIQSGTPPAGALVFWPNVAAPYGHVAIADGSGGVYTTMGMDFDNEPIARVSQTYFGTPAGWVLP